MAQKTRLRKCIENAKIKILREVDAMTQLLNKIQQIVNNVRVLVVDLLEQANYCSCI